MNTNKLADFGSNLGQSLASLLKVVLLSRKSTVKPLADADSIVILGNGPSLNDTMRDHADFLQSHKKLAVNFAANTDMFTTLRPEFYVLADPHFFNSDHENVNRLWDAFAKADWNMTLFVPNKINNTRILALQGKHITIKRYNMTPIEGFKGLREWMYRKGMGMPRPRNVLIPSIMLAINSGFKDIYVAGADHSWTKTISVDEDNRVVSIQPHFYKDNEKETTRINTEYLKYPLHQIIYSFYVAFRSYFLIKDYADGLNCRIWNITPGSFIDAFPRKKL